MATIVFFIDHQEGHVIPSFKLADSLRKRGHEVWYLSVMDNEGIIRAQGFNFFPLFTDIYPEGFRRELKLAADKEADNDRRVKMHLMKMMGGGLAEVISALRPDLFVVSVFLRMEALVLYYRYGISPVILTTYLRNPNFSFEKECKKVLLNMPGDTVNEMIEFVGKAGVRLKSLEDLLKPAASFHDLVLCPREMNIKEGDGGEYIHYVEPSIFQEREIGTKIDLSEAGRGKRILYATLGSGAVGYGKAAVDFFYGLINVMREECFSGYHLVLSVGQEFDFSGVSVPDNVTIGKWVSQIDVIRRAALVLAHGGLGTIKECIYHGVPMIVFPMAHDQFQNGGLIDHHGLGVSRRIEDISTALLRDDVLYVLNNADVLKRVGEMQRVFQEAEKREEGANVIEKLLIGKSTVLQAKKGGAVEND